MLKMMNGACIVIIHSSYPSHICKCCSTSSEFQSCKYKVQHNTHIITYMHSSL